MTNIICISKSSFTLDDYDIFIYLYKLLLIFDLKNEKVIIRHYGHMIY